MLLYGRAMETRRPLRAALVLAALVALAGLGCRGEGAGPTHPPGPLAVPAVAPAARDLGASGRPGLFVGWDGADWQLLALCMAYWAMPNLAAHVRAGRSGVAL